MRRLRIEAYDGERISILNLRKTQPLFVRARSAILKTILPFGFGGIIGPMIDAELRRRESIFGDTSASALVMTRAGEAHPLHPAAQDGRVTHWQPVPADTNG